MIITNQIKKKMCPTHFSAHRSINNAKRNNSKSSEKYIDNLTAFMINTQKAIAVKDPLL